MHTNLFQGQRIRLTAESPKVMAEFFTRANRDSEYMRLLDDAPARLWSSTKFQKWIEDDEEEKNPPDEYFFAIRTLEGDHLIGFVGLSPVYVYSDAWLGIGIGDRQSWSQGFGSEAMQLALNYAFNELNLERVSLGVFEYNARARHVYEKVGFKLEGSFRQAIRRDGQRYDVHLMGILRSEWQNGGAA